MSARLIDGKGFAQGLRARVAAKAAALKSAHGITPGLSVVLVGEDPASAVYVRNKNKAAHEAGFRAFDIRHPDTLSEDALLRLVSEARRREGLLADLLEGEAFTRGLASGDARRWTTFRDRLRRLRILAVRGSLRETVQAAIDQSEYGTATWLLRGGPRRAANFEKAVLLAESMEGRFGFDEFLDVLEDYRVREVKETEAPTGGEHENVVRLLTVHGAKGLEFPVVFVPDLSRSASFAAPDLLPGGGGVAAKVRLLDGDSAIETTAWTARRDERKSRESEESVRVLYVAITRAERRIVLSSPTGRRKPGAGSWHSLLAEVVDFSGEGEEGIRIRQAEPAAAAGPGRTSRAARHLAALAAAEPIGGTTAGDRSAARELFERAEVPRPEPDGTPYQATISELLRWSACPRCHWTRYHLGVDDLVLHDRAMPAMSSDEGTGSEPEDETPDRPGLDELPPTERGIAVHEILAVWDPRKGESVLETAESRLAGFGPDLIKPEDVRAAAELAASFYECEVGREVLDADPLQVRREVPFLVRWPTSSDLADLLFRGQIDLLYPRPDGTLHIVDYKTGHPSDRYRVQLVAYARAVLEFAPGDVEASLVYLRPGREPEIEPVPVGKSELTAVETRADAFAAYLRDGCPAPGEHAGECPLSP